MRAAESPMSENTVHREDGTSDTVRECARDTVIGFSEDGRGNGREEVTEDIACGIDLSAGEGEGEGALGEPIEEDESTLEEDTESDSTDSGADATDSTADATDPTADATDSTSGKIDSEGGERDYASLAAQDLAELQGEFPELGRVKQIAELDNPLRYGALRDLGLSPREAYLATQKRKRPDGRAHLTVAMPKGAGSPGGGMSTRQLAEARELFSDLGDSEIRSLYKKVTG